jgi:hypothetical protein
LKHQRTRQCRRPCQDVRISSQSVPPEVNIYQQRTQEAVRSFFTQFFRRSGYRRIFCKKSFTLHTGYSQLSELVKRQDGAKVAIRVPWLSPKRFGNPSSSLQTFSRIVPAQPVVDRFETIGMSKGACKFALDHESAAIVGAAWRRRHRAASTLEHLEKQANSSEVRAVRRVIPLMKRRL